MAAPPQPPTPENGAVPHVLVEIIANALATGLVIPGDPAKAEPPAMMQLPMFKTIGMPPPMAANVRDTTRQIVTAILTLIQQTHTLTPNEPRP